MQREITVRELENTVNMLDEIKEPIIIKRENKEDLVVISLEQYQRGIFLNKLDVPNYRISSENHVWNLVYLDGNWYHLDLTWDDPVTENNTNIRLDNFLLITTDQLEQLDTGYHVYDKSVYLEAK